jgi:Family of unknown function (DUF6364)
MTTKLTLSVSSKKVAKAKRHAKQKGTSISRLFEEHVTELTRNQTSEKPDPLESLRKLKGIAKGAISEQANNKDIIADLLIEKHLK